MIGDGADASSELPPMNDYGAIELELEAIMDTRWVKKGVSFIKESLIKWKRLPREDATWEDTELLKLNFPDVDLEVNGPLQGGGIDKLRCSSRVIRRNPKYVG